ncbi:MAG: hypothetical protein V1790_08100 [Planctomycetota bacterium]
MSGLRLRKMRPSVGSAALGLTAGALFFAFSAGSPAPAAEGGPGPFAEPVIRVEEDWKLDLNQPDGSVDSPQFHTIMSPYTDVDSFYAQVLWNYRETPDFTAGGVQLQSYAGESLIRRRSMEFGQLSTSAETITWTQSLTTDGVALSFEVTNGQSTTWGTFGTNMRISSDANLPDLSGYSPDVSAQESCVTYGGNRVDLLVITEVRYYGVSGLLGVDNTPRVVFQLDQE